MSKKLLMNSFSGGSGGLSPVQDGLVCWLDAFDLTTFENNGTWSDRMNNYDGIIRNAFNVYSINNGELHANGVVDIPNPTKGLTNYTIEIGYEDVAQKYWLGLFGNVSKKWGLTSDGTSFYQQGGIIGMYPLERTCISKEGIQNGKNYITITYYETGLTIYHNGVLLGNFLNNENATIYPSNAEYCCFMSRKPNSVNETTTGGADYKECKWYFIRFYNRVLTNEEITNNYNYELSLGRG